MPLVISDTSTLIHLAAIGKLALLRDLYQKITVPSAVWKEVVEGGKGRVGTVEIEAARQTGWIAIMPPTNELLIRLLIGLPRSFTSKPYARWGRDREP